MSLLHYASRRDDNCHPQDIFEHVNLVYPLNHSSPILSCILYSTQTFLKFHNFSSKVELTRLITIYYLLLLPTPFVRVLYSLKCHVGKGIELLYLRR